MDELKMTREWDKVFPKSDSVDHDKITFHNRYGITRRQTAICRRQARAGCRPSRYAAPSAR